MKRNLCLIVMALFAGAMLFSSCTKQYTITAVANDATMGTVTGGGTFLPNTTVTLVATANEGYEFVEWNDGNTDNPRIITVTENANYTATFQEVSKPGVAVTFGATSWDAASIDAAYFATYGAYDIYAMKDASGQSLPIVDVCAYATQVGSHTDAFDGDYWSNDIFSYLEYYNEQPLSDGTYQYGDWWGKSATINVSAFDATAMTMSANVTATMFDAYNALVEGAGMDAAPTTNMTVAMKAISMTAASKKAFQAKKFHGQKLFVK